MAGHHIAVLVVAQAGFQIGQRRRVQKALLGGLRRAVHQLAHAQHAGVAVAPHRRASLDEAPAEVHRHARLRRQPRRPAPAGSSRLVCEVKAESHPHTLRRVSIRVERVAQRLVQLILQLPRRHRRAAQLNVHERLVRVRQIQHLQVCAQAVVQRQAFRLRRRVGVRLVPRQQADVAVRRARVKGQLPRVQVEDLNHRAAAPHARHLRQHRIAQLIHAAVRREQLHQLLAHLQLRLVNRRHQRPAAVDAVDAVGALLAPRQHGQHQVRRLQLVHQLQRQQPDVHLQQRFVVLAHPHGAQRGGVAHAHGAVLEAQAEHAHILLRLVAVAEGKAVVHLVAAHACGVVHQHQPVLRSRPARQRVDQQLGCARVVRVVKQLRQSAQRPCRPRVQRQQRGPRRKRGQGARAAAARAGAGDAPCLGNEAAARSVRGWLRGRFRQRSFSGDTTVVDSGGNDAIARRLKPTSASSARTAAAGGSAAIRAQCGARAQRALDARPQPARQQDRTSSVSCGTQQGASCRARTALASARNGRRSARRTGAPYRIRRR